MKSTYDDLYKKINEHYFKEKMLRQIQPKDWKSIVMWHKKIQKWNWFFGNQNTPLKIKRYRKEMRREPTK